MFEFLFQYPARVFSKGAFVFLSGAPVWMLILAIAAAAAGLGLLALRRRGLTFPRRAVLWGLQAALVALLFTILWQPALRVSSLKSQQNVVAVLVDDSRSMAMKEGSETRLDQAKATLNGGLVDKLRDRFQVRLYSAGAGMRRVGKVEQLTGSQPSTQLGASLREAVAEAATLPVGAIVLLSDGADNSGGIDSASLAEVRRLRIPVHTIGYGREKFDRDLEISQVDLPSRSLPGSRVAAQVTFRQTGYANRRAKLVARSEGKTLASREVTMKADGTAQTESLLFAAGPAGPKTIEVALEGLDGEENAANNALRRLITVENRKPRVLYFEGEPRWEYKFLRRALDGDQSVTLASMVRTTPNKFFRQGISGATELEDGFPPKPEELFVYDGLVIGTVEASYFTPAQQEAIRLFVDRRGGGLLTLAGRNSLADGGYAASSIAEILPAALPASRNTFHREPAKAELTAGGRDSLIARLEDDPARNAEKWKKLPPISDYQELGAPKPGAVVLAEAIPEQSKTRWPLLVSHNYGRGRVSILATSGTWKWKMLQEHTDTSHHTFWQQLIRSLVTETPSRVTTTTPKTVLSDASQVPLRVELRDKNYLPVSDALVEARVSGPEGTGGTVALELDPLSEGVYTGTWAAEKPGSYLADISAKRGDEDLGRDMINFRREDGVAENFGVEQNRDLLEKLSAETGGKYYRPSETSKLLEEIALSEAGITVRETRDLWNMPIVFLLILLLAGAEWLLRRRWGTV
ncbi:MAG: hypothetical protein SFV18_04910 [Bryobacteraceae bacterium]|nr:hypothetical protein [Bryobacteraceae bacterium]